MTQEEKAKRYDDAIERAKQWRNAPNADKIPTFANRVIEEIFPELAESEDERIRKELLAVVNDLVLPDEQQSRFVAWLEKQVEQKPAWSEEDEKMIDAALQFAHEYGRHGLWCWLKSIKERFDLKKLREE